MTDAAAPDRRYGARCWTEARNALMLAEYPRRGLDVLLAWLNALPAPLPVRSIEAVITQAGKLGVQRVRTRRRSAGPHMELAAGRRTPEREALLRDMRLRFVTFPAMVPQLNALPGVPFTNWLQVRRWTRSLNLPPLAWTQGHPPLPAGARHIRKWSAERLAVLRRHVFPGALPAWEAVRAEVNALPGFPLESADHVRRKAELLELAGPTSPERRSALLSARRRQAAAPPKPPKPPKPAKTVKPPRAKPAPRAAPPATPVRLSPEEVDVKLAATQAHLRAALRVRNPDVAALASRFRVPLREVIRLRGLERTAQRGDQA